MAQYDKSNNLALEGIFENDGFVRGKSYDPETDYYDGEWDGGLEGVYDGLGTEYFIDGQIYVGSFVRGFADMVKLSFQMAIHIKDTLRMALRMGLENILCRNEFY